MVSRYCLGCHNEDLKTAGISLQGMPVTEAGANANTWEKVFRKVRTGEMPPLGVPKPDAATRTAFVNWLETELDRAAAAKPNPGAPSIHRLNRAEYSNSVRDLLGLDLDHSSSLPADDASYGFDNIGEVLTVSPLHMEKYMSTARRVSRLAVGTIKLSPSVEKFTQRRASASESLDELPLSVRGGLVVRRYFPVDAEYSILARVRGEAVPNLPDRKLDLRLDGKRVELFDVKISTAEEAQYTRNYELRIPLKAGMHTVGAGLLSESVQPEIGGGVRRPGSPATPTPLSVDYVLIGGPFNPTGPGETESRKRIFVCRPAEGKPEEQCATKILASLARRAYRRPVKKNDLKPLIRLFAEGRRDGGSFDSGIEMALRAILVSPDFLFRVDHDPKGSAPGTVHRVGDFELASRLSFFFWSSIPDEELLRLAGQGRLRDPAILNRQVSRMLADSRAKALVDNFAGQWLRLRNLAEWRPDPDKYPGFDPPLREAMQRETELFFDYIVREDRSLVELLDAGYTFVNERLAAHYGIPGVRGSYYRRVDLDGPTRGGILTQGSVLTVTSYPTRTSPVLRGKWILENVMGAPPPPPPPVVPALADNVSASPKNLREALEKHRADAGCASCHARLDPLGFALENYDAVGKFRTSEGGGEIDASGSLPGGITVRGAGDLKKVLLDRRDEFVECFAEKLLTYALGRGLEHYDFPAIRQIRRDAARNEYRFSSLAFAIVNSVPFQMRRTPER
ncbi:MAG TPA: DUF1592 domain-containing protein [Burkholderiales bacterium]|nr:DUF1592 domain-containing protein [Burkholderiales bacterium]